MANGCDNPAMETGAPHQEVAAIHGEYFATRGEAHARMFGGIRRDAAASRFSGA